MTANYRPNVGVMIVNKTGRVWLGRRANLAPDAPYGFQCPQGGIDAGETPEQAAFRELFEETGLTADKVRLLAQSSQWYTYDIPADFVKKSAARWTGQKQQWFLMLLTGTDADFKLDDFPEEIEFNDFKWVALEDVVPHIVPFKRAVYEQVVAEFKPFIERING